ncbi:MAG TPA: heme-copper oxidase subunit III [Ferruginibacter sp.]|nr:heme-copper oxidase subunit III [Ferruginibacter sp.]HRO18130.1 heme-copper oxidase subunit III [Ferruginibacter sp.]HRQ21519.1 heme-copper oxidase subunit III [Ferruginibacter sp.]
MNIVEPVQRNRIHPYKFNLWIAIGSMLMMFAGLTSAYIVKRNQSNWVDYELPAAFWFSTAAMILSSVTLILAKRSFNEKAMQAYRRYVFVTLILGTLFVLLQVYGFSTMWKSGLTHNSTVSVSFLYVIVGLHALHVAGGLVALILLALKAFNRKVKTYSSIPVELVATYWHFVDLLWIYLLVFLVMIR